MGLFLSMCAVSFLCMDILPLIEAVTGSLCTMVVSVICPALFYHQLVIAKGSRKRRRVMLKAVSPMFAAAAEPEEREKVVEDLSEVEEESGSLALRAVLYAYVVFGTVFGIYMFST